MKCNIGRRYSLLAISCMALVVCLWLPGSAVAGNAHLVHVGPSGLESYNAWTRKSVTLVKGMVGTWMYPVLSPNGVSAVTMKNNRTDRAYESEIYGAVISPSGAAAELSVNRPDGSIGMTSFLGWLDDYQAVFQQDDPNDPESGNQSTLVVDVRNPSDWNPYSGDVTYPSNGRKITAWDNACGVYVSRKGVATITQRKGKKRIARFKLPGFGGGKTVRGWNTGWEYWSSDAISISPDGKFVAYELFSQPNVGSSYMTWRVYVCTIKGKSAIRLKNRDGGFAWQ